MSLTKLSLSSVFFKVFRQLDRLDNSTVWQLDRLDNSTIETIEFSLLLAHTFTKT